MNNPQATAPRIGFDRFIPLDWATCALKVRGGVQDPEAIETLLDAAGFGMPSKTKARSVLRGLWLDPRPELAAFAERGVAIFKESHEVPAAALCWGMAIAVYPFFGKVAELVGRLTTMQGDCTAAEIHRRLAETYGEGEVTRRAANRVLQTQASWCTCERVDKGRRVIRNPATVITNEALIAWLIEAAIRYTGRAISVPGLQSAAVLYPFRLDHSLALVVSRSPTLELRSEGASSQLVMLQ
ncbi:hypothetical protein [uncultured Thiodictyon sp.]|uniref:hypothetical protein n=1 Tax=uncultured Thiodictyon sp. TaxID=1846217 RepID=UPI0025D10FF5|nr:hypothetical protein [uncultured Thiodictyon sp.]